MLKMYHKHFINGALKTKKKQEKYYEELYRNNKLSSQHVEMIDQFYLENYGKKINPIWHQYYTTDSDKFDVRYFPETLYIPKFEYLMNKNKRYNKVFEDKNILPLLAISNGVKMPKTIVRNVDGIYQDGDSNIITFQQLIDEIENVGSVFIKPTVDSYGGKGCSLLNISNGIDVGTNQNIVDIIKTYGNNFVIQELIVCSDELKALHPSSVNTIRIMTYIWNNELCVSPIVVRIGQGGSNVDNCSSGGMSIGMDQNGRLLPFSIMDNGGKRFYKHPDTGVVFDNYIIDGIDKVIDSAKKMHLSIPQIRIINWDFTIDSDMNPVFIEANIEGGSIDLFQKTHGKSLFGDKTEEILNWLKENEY